MRRHLRFTPLALLMLALAASTVAAGTITVGVGGFGGASVPLLQEDVRSGAIFGARVPVTLAGFFSVEPYFASTSLGNAEEDISGFTYTRDGFQVSDFGVNAAIGRLGGGTGFRIYPFAGIGSCKLTRKGSEDLKKAGYHFGFGVGISPASRFTLNLRGQLDMIVTDETSRKFGTATVGVSYDAWSR